MTSATATPATSNELGVLFQYTIEAYKTFQKLAENLPNPIAAAMFKAFAVEERATRDLLDIKYRDASKFVPLTLGADLRFQDIIEGDLSFREVADMLLVRERAMERRLMEASRTASPNDRNLFLYVAATKRAHVAFLERETQLLKTYPDWFKREDAIDLIIHGRGR
jgi:hypothetical protein